MKVKPQTLVGFKVNDKFRKIIEDLRDIISKENNRRTTITEVMIESVKLLAKQKGVEYEEQ